MKFDWAIMALIAAIGFGIGDFVVVFSQKKKMSVVTLYVMYTILVGILNLIYLLGFSNGGYNEVLTFGKAEWTIVGLLSTFYFAAYLLHFVAIQRAPNPGYGNSLVGLHTIILTVLAYWYLAKPLNVMAAFGIVLMIIGGTVLMIYAPVE